MHLIQEEEMTSEATRNYGTDKCEATSLVCSQQFSETQSETGRGKSETNIKK